MDPLSYYSAIFKIPLSSTDTQNILSGRWPCAGVPKDDVRRNRTRNSRRAVFGFLVVRYLAANCFRLRQIGWCLSAGNMLPLLRRNRDKRNFQNAL